MVPSSETTRTGAKTPATLRAVAVFEAAKGLLVLLAGFGLLELIHHDVERVAEELVGHLHLNPAKHLPRVFLEAASRLNDVHVWTLALMAGAYASLRLLEAYGLWRNQTWAEWLAVVSGAIYVPFEIRGLLHRFDWLKLSLLILNLGVVAVIAQAVWRRKRSERQRSSG
jgi:uncharacterized membrane protein (DUF2068 family)